MTVLHRLTLSLTTAALCAGLLAGAAHAAEPKNPGEWLQQANVTDLSGKPVSLAWTKGQTVVVNFWASWCSPCVQEMPALDKMSRSYAKKGVRFVGIAIDTPQAVQKFVAKTKVSYPLVVGGYGGGDLMRRFGNGLGGLPYTAVIDKQGNIRLSHIGALQPGDVDKALKGL